jgi:hypothetical protein
MSPNWFVGGRVRGLNLVVRKGLGGLGPSIGLWRF